LAWRLQSAPQLVPLLEQRRAPLWVLQLVPLSAWQLARLLARQLVPLSVPQQVHRTLPEA
jgi:hypothetical protein